MGTVLIWIGLLVFSWAAKMVGHAAEDEFKPDIRAVLRRLVRRFWR